MRKPSDQDGSEKWGQRNGKKWGHQKWGRNAEMG